MPKSETSLNDILYDLKRIEENREILTEEKIQKIYQSLNKKLNTFVGNEYIKHADEDGKMYVSYLYKNNNYANFLEKISENVAEMSNEVKSEITKLVDTTYKNCYKGMAKAFSKAYTDTEFAKLAKAVKINPHILNSALNNNISKLTLPHILEKHRQDITYQIQQELNMGLINGERYEKMAKRISDRVDVSYNKAMNIVRTESHRNTEAGLMDCAKDIQDGLNEEDGVVYCATWCTMQDQRVRPNQRVRTKKGWRTYQSHNGANHQKMEGKTVKVGDTFELEATVKTEKPGSSGVARHDCNCRCFLEYNLLTFEEYEKVTGKHLQYYRKPEIDKDDTISAKRGKVEINSSKAKTTLNDMYISDSVDIKPKELHTIDTEITEALNKLNVKSNAENMPKIVIINNYEMQKNAVASYNPMSNYMYVNKEFVSPKGQKNKSKGMGSSIATYIHEFIHWLDAIAYIKKHGKFNNDKDIKKYFEFLDKKAEKKLAKLKDMRYNIDGISPYAQKSYKNKNYDETYTEYRTKNVLEE